MTEHAVSRLSALPLFASLSEQQVGTIERSLRHVSVKMEGYVFQENDPGDAMYVIESGRLKVFIVGVDGEALELDILGPGDVLGELAVLDGKPRSASAVAITDCELLAIDRSNLMAVLRANPDVAIAMLGYVTGRMRQITLQTEALSLSDSTVRLGRVLLMLAERNGVIRPGVLTTSLQISELADVTGTSPDWVVRILNRWQDSSIILISNQTLVLRDVATLKVLCRREG
jgi:CRP-like cAMP-binding protein